jgi:hypothetical protein
MENSRAEAHSAFRVNALRGELRERGRVHLDHPSQELLRIGVWQPKIILCATVLPKRTAVPLLSIKTTAPVWAAVKRNVEFKKSRCEAK